jgi:amino acid transporter
MEVRHFFTNTNKCFKTAASFTIQYWAPDFNVAISISIFFVVIIFINLFGTLGYAEEEFWASSLKLIVVIAFLITGIVINCGGGPSSGDFGSYVGGEVTRFASV